MNKLVMHRPAPSASIARDTTRQLIVVQIQILQTVKIADRRRHRPAQVIFGKIQELQLASIKMQELPLLSPEQTAHDIYHIQESADIASNLSSSLDSASFHFYYRIVHSYLKQFVIRNMIHHLPSNFKPQLHSRQQQLPVINIVIA